MIETGSIHGGRSLESRLFLGQTPRAVPAFDLTPREQQALRHIAYGLSNQEIASCLEISVETVKEHVQNILRKLSMKDRTQMAAWAVKEGLV